MDGLEQAVRESAKGCLCLPTGAATCIRGDQFKVLRIQGAAAPQRMQPDGRLWTLPEGGTLQQLGLEGAI